MNDILDIVKELSLIDAPSGREKPVRDKILELIGDSAECNIDKLGNIICEKKGDSKPENKIMIDAHMDEVGIIITSVSDNGRIKFDTVGGIDPSVLLGRRIKFGNVNGIIECIPIHLTEKENSLNLPKIDDMCIDIGTSSKEESLKYVSLGETGVFQSDFTEFGDGFIKCKALDDRIGCAILIYLIKQDLPYDMTFTFTVQEEVGLIGAKTATFTVAPHSAIVLETTTAADIAGSDDTNFVCSLGNGPVVSFMDRRTVYNKNYYDQALKIAKEKNIKAQPKCAVAGGNNAGSIHSSNDGVATLALSVPCRYLHSAVCVVNKKDIYDTAKLALIMAEKIASNSVRAV